jgi:Zn-finger nucleic acid-binding protein
MELQDIDVIQMELKYCERCGALWLRLTGSDHIFCSPCSVILAGLARDPRFREQRGSISRGPELDRKINSAFWSEGGNA